jgi:hypothetical protein
MDRKTFIVEFTKATAWPLLIVTSFFLFKTQIQEIIKNISELKFGKVSAVFSKERLATSISKKDKEESNNEGDSLSLTEEDIFNIPDDDYVFMQEISVNEAFMPINENQKYKYNSLVNNGYFTKKDSDDYQPTKLGKEILTSLKSIYHK